MSKRKKKPDRNIVGVLEWSDRHDPFVDRAAEAAILEFAADRQPEKTVYIGDNLDLGGISRWSVRNFIQQYEERVLDGLLSFGAHLNAMVKACPKTKIYWVLGNHDERLEAFIEQHPSWRGICDDILGLLEFYGKCKVVNRVNLVHLRDPEDDFRIGKMHFAHGFHAGKYPAARNVEEYDESVTCGHAHTMQMHTMSKRGQPRAGYVIGNLLSRDGRRYLKGRATRWVTGFAYLEVDKVTGDFTQHLLPIVNGRFRFAGVTYGKG